DWFGIFCRFIRIKIGKSPWFHNKANPVFMAEKDMRRQGIWNTRVGKKLSEEIFFEKREPHH
ncbi:MAG: hypothetical protein ACOCW9_07250, partial [Thermodesulfobacteriota bacterium]